MNRGLLLKKVYERFCELSDDRPGDVVMLKAMNIAWALCMFEYLKGVGRVEMGKRLVAGSLEGWMCPACLGVVGSRNEFWSIPGLGQMCGSCVDGLVDEDHEDNNPARQPRPW